MPIVFRSNYQRLVREKSIREDRDITDKEIAEATGISAWTLSKLKKPSATFNSETLDKLCIYFDVPIERLVTHVPLSERERVGDYG